MDDRTRLSHPFRTLNMRVAVAELDALAQEIDDTVGVIRVVPGEGTAVILEENNGHR